MTTIDIRKENAKNEMALSKFAKKNLIDTQKSTSAQTINDFATLILSWLNTEYRGNSIETDTLKERIFSLAEYEGETKNDDGIITSERNTTFENNVSNAILISLVWYYKENDEDNTKNRNSADSPYFYFRNNVFVVVSEYANVKDDFTPAHARQPLKEIPKVYNRIFGIESEATRQKSLLRKIESINEDTFNKLLNSFIKVPSKKEQKQGNKEISFKYDELAEKTLIDLDEIKEALSHNQKMVNFFSAMVNYVNDENNFDQDDENNTTVQVDEKLKADHLKVFRNLRNTINDYNKAPVVDGGIEEHSQVA
jgi:hypothetical protein